MTRAELVEQKEAVKAEIVAIQRRLGQTRGSDARPARIAELEARLQALMAEEHRLRLLIDRTR
jgi:hypothetical protein